MVGKKTCSKADMVVVSCDNAKRLVVDVLEQQGSETSKAALQAEHLVEADLRAQHSHGIQRMPVLVGRMRRGVLCCNAEPIGEWATDAVLIVDGQRGFGPVVTRWCGERLEERAARTGVAVGLIHNTNHLGMLAPYTERLAARGLVALAFTTSEALVHPVGSARPMIGTNPMAIAVPGEPGTVALSLDMSTAAVSAGKIMSYGVQGLQLEPGWAVDQDGRPTLDPDAAQRGAISPFGGAKGYALGLALEVLVGTLTGTSFGSAVTGTLDVETVCSKGDAVICVDMARLGLTDRAQLTNYLSLIRAGGVAGTPRVDVPGDRAFRVRAARLESGIPYARETWLAVERLRRGGVEVADVVS